MKLVAALSALTLMSMGVANAATAQYDFNNVTNGQVLNGALTNSTPFATGLIALGVTSVSFTNGPATLNWNPPGGSQANANPAGFAQTNGGVSGTGSYFSGWGGSWTLVFGPGGGPSGNVNGVNSFQFVAFESESTPGGSTGYTVDLYNLSNVLISSTAFGQSPNAGGQPGQTVTFTPGQTIGRVVITDLGDATHSGGDGIQIDNLQVDTNLVGTPEPSTYLMIGSALAGLALRRRRA